MRNMYVQFESFTTNRDLIENTYKSTLEYGTKKKEEGNKLFKEGEIWKSINCYHAALSKLLFKTWNDTKDLLKLIATTCSNLAACYIKIENYEEALVWCDTALEIEKKNDKCLYRKALCYKNLGYHNKAQVVINDLLRYYPNDNQLKEMCEKLMK